MLELKNIKKSYNAGNTVTAALDDVSVTFGEREFVAILGTSGSGKTTMLNVIGGLDCYDSGDLVINGVSTKLYRDRDWDTYRNHSIGFVFQSYNLIPHQSVLANVELALTLSGVPRKERRRRAKEALCRVGLGDQLRKKPSQMSGGQMQRVAIARALVNDPDILLADEPTGALDTATSIQIMELLREISKTKLIIMVTHNPDLARDYATRIVRLSDGKIISDEANTPKSAIDENISAVAENKAAEPAKEKKKGKKAKTSMSFFTALSLSLNNLMTKKARTILTSFAGSIGIIGIALILSISNGVQANIDKIQEDTLSGYPITIMEENIDMNEMLALVAGNTEAGEHGNDKVYSSSQMFDMLDSFVNMETSKNNLHDFKKYLESEEKLNEYASAVTYGYGTDLLIYGHDVNDNLVQINPSTVENAMYEAMGVNVSAAEDSLYSAMSSNRMAVWSEIIPERSGNGINGLVRDQYDVIAGSWPENWDEVVLVVDENNEISDVYLYSLGLKDQAEISNILNEEDDGEKDSQDSWEYDELVGKKFYAVLPASKYADNDGDGVWTDMSSNEEYMKITAEGGIELRISGIIRPNPKSTSTSIQGAVGYTSALTRHLIDLTNDSAIVKQQKGNEAVDVFSGLPFDDGRPEPTGEEKAEAFRAYTDGLNTKAAAELYVKIASLIPSDMLSSSVENAMAQYPDRAAMEAAIISAYTESSGANVETITKYISEMSDEDVEKAVRDGAAAQISAAYAERIAAELMAVPEEQLAAMLKNQVASADETALSAYYDEYMPATVSDSTFDDNMKRLSAVDLDFPASINIYASTFEAKDEIANLITEYNSGVDEADQISYTDYVAILMSSITTIINSISYVLIAFVSISLIVSSIMIGIITYISVLERTKEIGILRAIGASKKDVTRVFNAETLIVGLAAGLIGIGVTELLCIPINIIIENLTDMANIASLPWQGGVILVTISVVLTMIAGLLPSLLAARKDPVVALRTE